MFKTTILLLKEIENLLHLDYKPKAVFYDIKKNDKIQIISILLNNNLSVPIFNEFVNELDIKKQNLAVIYQSLEETINQNILKYNNIKVYNKWIQNVKEHNYMTESYNLYRLELSLYLAKNLHIRDKIIDIVRNKTRDSSGTMSINKKKHLLRYILYKILNKKLSEQYKITLDNEFKLNHLDKDLNIKTEFGYITDNYPYLEDYEIKNVRDYCEINNTKDKCTQNLHCKWKNDSCKLVLLDTLAIDFVNKVIDEIIQDGIQFKELIQENEYYVSDIVDYSQFTNRPNQKIIKARTPIKVANTVAFFFEICPVTTGRFAVRAINLSRSLSITILKALALPAARVPAKIVAKANPNSGNPLAAKTIAGNVETSKSSTTRNFIRSRYPRIALLTRQDYPAFRSTPPRPLTGIIVTLLSTETADQEEKVKQ